MLLELHRIDIIMDRVEARIGGARAMPFINPCPSSDEWLEIRKLLIKIENDAQGESN